MSSHIAWARNPLRKHRANTSNNFNYLGSTANKRPTSLPVLPGAARCACETPRNLHAHPTQSRSSQQYDTLTPCLEFMNTCLQFLNTNHHANLNIGKFLHLQVTDEKETGYGLRNNRNSRSRKYSTPQKPIQP